MKLTDIFHQHKPRPDGILRVRRNIWANPDCYIELDVTYGPTRVLASPWARLFDAKAHETLGIPSPQIFPFCLLDTDDWSEYEKKQETNE